MGELALRAKGLAMLAHAGQKYGKLDYTGHLEHVVGILHEYGFVSDLMDAIAWLHDSLEDTKMTYEMLDLVMGPNVAKGVEALTGRGNNRKERQSDLLKKLQVGIPRWVIIKLADRIANIRNAHLTDTGHFLRMYVEEHQQFRDALYQISRSDRYQVEKMWEDLDQLITFYSKRVNRVMV